MYVYIYKYSSRFVYSRYNSASTTKDAGSVGALFLCVIHAALSRTQNPTLETYSPRTEPNHAIARALQQISEGVAGRTRTDHRFNLRAIRTASRAFIVNNDDRHRRRCDVRLEENVMYLRTRLYPIFIRSEIRPNILCRAHTDDANIFQRVGPNEYAINYAF